VKVLIADDEEFARELLATLLAELPGLQVVAQACDGEEAIAATRQHRPDVVFLDIDMPNLNGIHAAVEISALGGEVIFVTAHEEHAVDAFEIGAVDYLLKPLRRPRLKKAMERAWLRYEARQAQAERPAAETVEPRPAADAAFWLPVSKGTVRVPVQDLVRIEAAGDHAYLHTAQRAYLHRTTMAALEEKLRGSGLLRVHRSAFIRPERVVRMERRGKVLTLLLDDGAQIPVGPRFRAAALQALGRLEA
jgi:DNA-binding LytR/AlgR family response regulator